MLLRQQKFPSIEYIGDHGRLAKMNFAKGLDLNTLNSLIFYREPTKLSNQKEELYDLRSCSDSSSSVFIFIKFCSCRGQVFGS